MLFGFNTHQSLQLSPGGSSPDWHCSVCHGSFTTNTASTSSRHDSQVQIYSSCILSVLLYSRETWTLCRSDGAKLESFHTKCQHRILCIKWNDFICNADVYSRSGLQTTGAIVRSQRLTLFRHVARMPFSWWLITSMIKSHQPRGGGSSQADPLLNGNIKSVPTLDFQPVKPL